MKKILILFAFILISIASNASAEAERFYKKFGEWDFSCEKYSTDPLLKDCVTLSSVPIGKPPGSITMTITFHSGFSMDLFMNYAGFQASIKRMVDSGSEDKELIEAMKYEYEISKKIVDHIDNYDVTISTDKSPNPFVARARAVVPIYGDFSYFNKNNLMKNSLFLESFIDANTAKVVFTSINGSERYEYNYNIAGFKGAAEEINKITQSRSANQQK